MILDKFKTGWQNTFEKRLTYIDSVLAPGSIKSIERFRGMLRVKFETLDNDMQYVLDCVSYKMERESVRICENCGEYSFRRFEEYLEEPMSLCLRCYTLLVDELLNKNS